MFDPQGVNDIQDPEVEREVSDGTRDVTILGVPLVSLTMSEACGLVVRWIEAGRLRRLYFANAHTLDLTTRRPGYREILRCADAVFNDGIGVSMAARLKGTRFRSNLCGTDLIPVVLRSLRRPCRIALIGGDGVAEAAAQAMARESPFVNVVACASGFGTTIPELVLLLREANPDLTLVGMGNPLQEETIHRLSVAHERGVFMGVGALFDFMAGRVPRAPLLLRRARAEWLFRLLVEPRRLAYRYLVRGPVFALNALLDVAKRAPVRTVGRARRSGNESDGSKT